MAACNKRLLKEFGVLHAVPKRNLATLLGGLPDPFLAIAETETLRKNASLPCKGCILCLGSGLREERLVLIWSVQ